MQWINELIPPAFTSDQWAGGGLVMVCIGLLCYIAYLNSPRSLERKMARKMERQRIADITSKALDDAMERGEISVHLRDKYHDILGKAFNIPDLIRRKKFNVQAAISASYARLSMMGVKDIVSKLSKLRRVRPSKKERLLARLSKKEIA